MCGPANRCQVIEGDFFASVPAGSDAYILSHVLHDWNDVQCVSILRNCRRAVPPSGRLVIVEAAARRRYSPPRNNDGSPDADRDRRPRTYGRGVRHPARPRTVPACARG
ncbi:MAG: hypothetical protein J2P54_20045 [Bradyrhizobiaceae bacterium]|nr:hypothetical protein [Bradyrhizobiaceae bacterium]